MVSSSENKLVVSPRQWDSMMVSGSLELRKHLGWGGENQSGVLMRKESH